MKTRPGAGRTTLYATALAAFVLLPPAGGSGGVGDTAPQPECARARPVLSSRSAPSRSADELSDAIECGMRGITRSGTWGVLVVSLSRGDTIYSRNADSLLLPASTMKLFTTALALDQFGPDHRFRTTVLRMGELDSAGVVDGDMILRGDGDPAFSNKFGSGSASAPVDVLAELVRGAGVTHVRGDLVADPYAFDAQLVPDGWQQRYLHDRYAARVSALSLNENIASVVVQPAEGDNDASAELDPPAATMSVLSSVRTLPGRSGASVAVRRVDEFTFEARGWIGERSAPRRYDLVVEDPVSFTVGAFRSSLAARGIVVDGEIRVDITPFRAQTIAELPSPPLASLLTVMNRESINHYAELIFRNAGRGENGVQVGSAAAGMSRLTDLLATKAGIDPAGFMAADGSGLSVLNRTSPRAMVELLGFAHNASWSDVFHASLPVAGESATLATRMRGSPAQGNLHAKTGTTSGVIALSGYVTADDGEILAFAFLYNGTDRDRARRGIDQIAPLMVSLIR